MTQAQNIEERKNMSIEDQNIIVNKNQSSFVWNHEILHFQSIDAYNPGSRYMYYF